jgi:Icc-related predicted phosphoesterase
MRLGHFSDLHGNLRNLLSGSELPDVWVNSGDFFPNATRGDRSVEVGFQAAWFRREAASIMARLGGRPVVWVGGNHDYVNFADLLREFGYEGPAYDITSAPVDLGGHRFAGIREIPWIAGEWNGEMHDLSSVVDRAFDMDPTILVTHAPAAGILDDDHGAGHGCGNRPLATALAYRPHRVVAHLCGHIHEQGGRDIEEMGIHFFNGAENIRFIEVP